MVGADRKVGAVFLLPDQKVCTSARPLTPVVTRAMPFQTRYIDVSAAFDRVELGELCRSCQGGQHTRGQEGGKSGCFEGNEEKNADIDGCLTLWSKG